MGELLDIKSVELSVETTVLKLVELKVAILDI